jgi:hypothetical protein
VPDILIDNDSEPKEACRIFSRISTLLFNIVKLPHTLDSFLPGHIFYLSASFHPLHHQIIFLSIYRPSGDARGPSRSVVFGRWGMLMRSRSLKSLDGDGQVTFLFFCYHDVFPWFSIYACAVIFIPRIFGSSRQVLNTPKERFNFQSWIHPNNRKLGRRTCKRREGEMGEDLLRRAVLIAPFQREMTLPPQHCHHRLLPSLIHHLPLFASTTHFSALEWYDNWSRHFLSVYRCSNGRTS